MSRSRYVLIPAALVVLAMCVIAYSSVADFGFLYGDDERHIRDNVYVQSLSLPNLLWMFSSAEIDYWRPLSFLTNALDYSIWGQYIGGHHITSVAIHAVSALLVMGIAWVVFPMVFGHDAAHWRLLAGLAAGVLFAIHPQHVETTAWLAERKGVLSSCFYIAAIWSYLCGRGEQLRWRALTLLFVLLAMLSKPLAVSLPLTLLMLDVYPLKRLSRTTPWRQWLAVVLEKTPYVAMAVAVSLYTYLAIETGGYLNSTDVLGLSERLINAARTVWLYIGRYALPISLVPIYPMEMIDNSLTAANLLAPLALVVTAAAAVWLWWRGNGALLGVSGVHMAMLGPVLGLVHVGAQSSADRYAYLPGAWMSVACGLALAAALHAARGRRAIQVMVLLLAVGISAVFVSLTRQQVMVWSSDTSMTAIVTHHYPDWQTGHYYVRALKAFNEGNCTEAIPLFEIAIAQNQLIARSHMFLAHCLQQARKGALAQQHMRTSLRLKPRSPFLLQMGVQLEVGAGRLDEASELLARLAAEVPDDPEIERQRALMRMQMGDLDGATQILQSMARRDGGDVRNTVLLGIVAHRRGAFEEARKHYLEALRMDPENDDARHNLEQLPSR